MADPIWRSFAGGELSPSLWARTDQTKYQTGLRTCRNFEVQRHGGVANRAGTRFITKTKFSGSGGLENPQSISSSFAVGSVLDDPVSGDPALGAASYVTRLIKFVFNKEQTYVLEFGPLYVRFIRNGAQVLVKDSDAPAWNGTTNYVPGDIVSNGSTFVAPPGVCFSNKYYCRFPNVNVPPTANSATWYRMQCAPTGTDAIYEIPTPYVLQDIRTLRYVQSADVLTVVHKSYAPRNLSRYGHLRWVMTDILFNPQQVPPTNFILQSFPAGSTANNRWAITAINAETGEESLPLFSPFSTMGAITTSAPARFVWTLAPNASKYFVYRELNGVFGFIGIAASGSFVDEGVVPSISDNPPNARNPFSNVSFASGNTVVGGNYPSVVGYYQGRRIFANTLNKPETVFGSKSGIYDNFTVSSPAQDDDAVTFNLAGPQVNHVRAVVGMRKLMVLTSAGEWSIEGDASGVITQGNVNPSNHSHNGCAEVPPVVVGNSLLYVQFSGSAIRDLGFDVTIDGYKGDDISLFAEHLFAGHQITDMDYAQSPNSVVWCVRDDGVLIGLTYIKSQMVFGWHRHDTVGGVFESVCVVPEGGRDALYCIVKRVIGGVVERHIERLESRFITDNRVKSEIDQQIDVAVNSFFVDSGLTYNGINKDTVDVVVQDYIPITEVVNQKNVGLNSVTWNQTLNLFVAVGNADGADAYIVIAGLDGVTSEIANPKNVTLNDVIWNDTLRIFVAVGNADGVDAYILMADVDGVITELANPKNIGLNAVEWSPFLRIFVAVGKADGVDAYILMADVNGVITELANPKNRALNDVVWGDIFVAVGEADGVDAYILTGDAGGNIVERVNPKNVTLNAVCWRPQQVIGGGVPVDSRFVAVGNADGVDAYIVVSTGPEGITWTEVPNPKNVRLNDVIWCQDLKIYVAVGDADGVDAYIITSPNGIVWTEIANPKNINLNSIVWNGSVFVAVGGPDGTDAYIIYSTGLSQALGVISTKNSMVLTGGVTWEYTENLTLTSSNDTFTSGSVGNQVVLKVGADTVRCTITAYSTAKIVTVRANKTVPVGFRGVPLVDWAMAVDKVSGLGHLKGKTVSILADGMVVSNGVDEPIYTVPVSGEITLPKPYSVIHVGLPIIADVETLDIDSSGPQTIANRPSLITEVDLLVESARGIRVGPDAEHLIEYKQRDQEDYDSPPTLKTGLVKVNSNSTYGYGGRVFIRQYEPLPLTVLAASPVGFINKG